MSENRTFYANAVNTSAKWSWKDVFTDVFKPHTRAQRDATMSAGLTGCIPEKGEMLGQWQKPWLFARVLGLGALLFFLTYLSIRLQGLNMGTLGILCMVPAAVVPLAVVIFFWELNIPRNISFGEIMYVLLFGSVVTFLITTFLNEVLGLDAIDNANVACFPEEIAKLVLVCICLRKSDRCYGLNGILIGGAVGAGFAIMESEGYAIYYGLLQEGSIAAANSSFITRGLLSIGGHTVWAALYGGAIALAKGRSKLEAKHFANPLVLITIATSILLHFTWNSAGSIDTALQVQYAYSGSQFAVSLYKFLFNYWFYYIILIAIAWAVLLLVLRRSVQQVVALSVLDGEIPAAARSARPRSTAALTCVEGELKGRSYPLAEGGTLTIGRAPDCAVRFGEHAPGVSGHHCRVEYRSGAVYLTDTGSTYGTFLADGTKLVPGAAQGLSAGQEFYLAQSTNSFRVTL